MKKIFTLSLCLLQCIILLATAPTVPSSAFVFSYIDGNKFNVKFTSGNGTSRIVVMRAGNAVTGLPINGSDYTANLSFGTPSTLFTAPGEYVVYKGSSNFFTVTNLQPNTVYHLSVFEYNGSGATTEYLMTALSGSQSTATTPTVQTHTITFSNVTGNSVKLNWINGNGQDRLIVARKSSAVNVVPTDLSDYSASTNFGSGSALNGDNYVVYKSSGSSATINLLEPNTTYHFSFFERNGISAPLYLLPAATASVTTNAGPTVNSGSFIFNSQEGNRFTVNCSRGNGSKRLYIARKAAPVTATPVNGTNYSSNTAFGLGQEIAPGEFVFNSSSESSVTLTNLEPSTTYHVRSFEYDEDAAGNTYFLTTNPSASSYSTASAPAPASNISFSNVTGNSATIHYNAGGGGYRMVIMKENTMVDATPENLVRYPGNTSFGTASTQLGTGNYVVNGGANGTVTAVTNLHPGVTYHVSVYEFSGNYYPMYAATAATATITLPAQPTSPATSFIKNLIEGNSFRANWTNGDGTRRVVVARKDIAVTAAPVDGTTYTANNNFGQGTQLADGQFVVYDGIGMNVDIKNLEIGTTYHVAIYEYNLSGTSPDYLTSTWLAGNATTLIAPTQQIPTVTASSIQAQQVTLNFTAGNGGGRIFVMRESAPVNADPVDLVVYNPQTAYGNAELGTGNYLVHKTTGSNSFIVTGLNPGTQYYVAAYEYNGSSGPVYNRPGITMNFTTIADGVPTPTTSSSAPVFTNIEGNKLTFGWTNGNGTSRIVVARQGQAVTFVPVNGATYTANTSFGSGTDLGNGQFIIFNGSSNSVTTLNLSPSSNYHFVVYEYNGSGAGTRYLTANTLAANSPTATIPTTVASAVTTSFTGNSITLNWSNGNGTGRLVAMQEGDMVNAVPVDLSVYPASAVFGNGSQIGTGEYVVYSGNGNGVTITGLTANRTYHFRIFEYNGSSGPVYNTLATPSGSATTSVVLPVRWLYFRGKENNDQVTIEWGTSSELNSAYFVVERSVNGADFVPLDTIAAAGNSASDQHYIYADRRALNTTTYYRIKQADVDGRYNYSVVIALRKKIEQPVFTIFPNPAITAIRTTLPANSNTARLSIYDAQGRMVIQQKISNNSLVPVDQLQHGVYYIVVEDGTTRYTEKLIKQ